MTPNTTQAHFDDAQKRSERKFKWALEYWQEHPELSSNAVNKVVKEHFGSGINPGVLNSRHLHGNFSPMSTYAVVSEGTVLAMGDARVVWRKLGEELAKLGIHLYQLSGVSLSDIVDTLASSATALTAMAQPQASSNESGLVGSSPTTSELERHVRVKQERLTLPQLAPVKHVGVAELVQLDRSKRKVHKRNWLAEQLRLRLPKRLTRKEANALLTDYFGSGLGYYDLLQTLQQVKKERTESDTAAVTFGQPSIGVATK